MAKSKPPIKQKYIESPEKLWEYFTQFVEHERNHPMFKREYVGKDGDPVDTALQVPITFEGFECWIADLGVINDLGDYVKNKDNRYESYAPIVTRIRNNCFAQNFKGAAVGLFNANLIAKKLGITEKIEAKTENINRTITVEVLPSTTPLSKSEKDITLD